jgi:hypothetical protein
MLPIERACVTDEPMGLPSPEALRVAIDVVTRRYALPETIEHLQIRAECMTLAYLIMAYDLAPTSDRLAGKSSPLPQVGVGDQRT